MIIISFSLILTAFLLLLHWFIYRTAVRFLEIRQPAARRLLLIALLLLGISFLPASYFASRAYNPATRILYTLAAGWMGFAVYFFLASITAWIAYGLLRRTFMISVRKIAAVLFIFSALASGYGIIHASSPSVTTITVAIPNLPQEWDGKTAVWISDTHLGQVRGAAFADRIARQVDELHPDILFIGGDFYDGVTTDYNRMAQPFSPAHLSVPWGTYFITGNHEEFSHGASGNRFIEAVRNAGITVLTNQKTEVRGMQLLGVDYASTRSAQSFRDVLNALALNKTQPSILLKHIPLQLDVASQAGITFQISGHTHRGQIFPGSLFTSSIFKGYDYGLKKFGQMQVYTSSGAGTWGPPMRIGTKPEIVQILFHKQ